VIVSSISHFNFQVGIFTFECGNDFFLVVVVSKVDEIPGTIDIIGIEFDVEVDVVATFVIGGKSECRLFSLSEFKEIN